MIPDDLSRLLGQQAEADQAQAGARDFARTFVAFRDELIQGGFHQEKAEDMAHAYLETTLDMILENARPAAEQ